MQRAEIKRKLGVSEYAIYANVVQVKEHPPALKQAPLALSATETCQFITSHARPWIYCDAPSLVGSSWCAVHHAICLVPSRPAVAYAEGMVRVVE